MGVWCVKPASCLSNGLELCYIGNGKEFKCFDFLGAGFGHNGRTDRRIGIKGLGHRF